MPNSQFSGTGINNGLTIEANQVSQSVDAFTGNKAYDIVISGSLELTGSLFLTGSLINEYTGQFKTLGIGVIAPTEPTMLHIKTTDGGGDPLVLIEASAGANNAQLQLQNDTTYYELGNYGDLTNTFRIRQGPAGGTITRTPFIIGSNTADYTIFLDTDSVGIGLGINTPTILSPLAAGSLQSAGTLTGSLVQGNIISASDAGVGVVNIHGTSSYANYATTVVTASYIEATNIDFSVGTNTITQDIYSSANITTTATSSFGRAQMGVGGISTPDSLGSTGDTLKFTTLLTLPTPSPTTNANGVTGDLSTTSSGTGQGVTVRVTAAANVITEAKVIFGGTIGTGYEAGDTITVSKVDMDNDGSIGTVSGDLVMTIQQSNMTSPYYEIISGSSDNLQIGNIDLNAALNGTRLEVDSGGGWVRIKSTEDFKGNLFVQDEVLAGNQVKVSGSTSPSMIVGYDSPGSSGLRAIMTSERITFQGQPNAAYIYNDSTNPTATLHLGTGNSSTESGLYVSGSKEVTIPNGPLVLVGAAVPATISDIKTYQIIGHETPDGADPGIYTTKKHRIIQNTTTSTTTIDLIQFIGGVSGNIPNTNATYNFKLTLLGIRENSGAQAIYMEQEWTLVYDISSIPKWSFIATTPLIRRSTADQISSTLSYLIASDNLTFQLTPGSVNNCRWDGMVDVEVLQGS